MRTIALTARGKEKKEEGKKTKKNTHELLTRWLVMATLLLEAAICSTITLWSTFELETSVICLQWASRNEARNEHCKGLQTSLKYSKRIIFRSVRRLLKLTTESTSKLSKHIIYIYIFPLQPELSARRSSHAVLVINDCFSCLQSMSVTSRTWQVTSWTTTEIFRPKYLKYEK